MVTSQRRRDIVPSRMRLWIAMEEEAEEEDGRAAPPITLAKRTWLVVKLNPVKPANRPGSAVHCRPPPST